MLQLGGRDGVVCTMTAPHARRSGVRNPAEVRDFSLFLDVQTESGSHVALYSLGTGVLPWE